MKCTSIWALFKTVFKCTALEEEKAQSKTESVCFYKSNFHCCRQ